MLNKNTSRDYSNYATIQQSHTLNEEQRIENAQVIVNAANRLSGLVTNILKLNKLDIR